MKKKYLLPILAITILLLIIISFKKQKSTVIEIPIKKGEITQAVYAIGTVTAKKTYEIKPGITSIISDIYVSEGDNVKKGDPLIRLDTLFTAPFSGTITYLPYIKGETVFPQMKILTLTDLTDRYIVVLLEQQGALIVREGQKAILNFENMRQSKFEGTVKSIFSNNNQFLVHIESQNLPKEILPGMTTDVAITIQKKSNALLIPIQAIKNGKVSRKRNGKNKEVEIQTGLIDDAMAEVVSGDIQEFDTVTFQKK